MTKMSKEGFEEQEGLTGSADSGQQQAANPLDAWKKATIQYYGCVVDSRQWAILFDTSSQAVAYWRDGDGKEKTVRLNGERGGLVLRVEPPYSLALGSRDGSDSFGSPWKVMDYAWSEVEEALDGSPEKQQELVKKFTTFPAGKVSVLLREPDGRLSPLPYHPRQLTQREMYHIQRKVFLENQKKEEEEKQQGLVSLALQD